VKGSAAGRVPPGEDAPFCPITWVVSSCPKTPRLACEAFGNAASASSSGSVIVCAPRTVSRTRPRRARASTQARSRTPHTPSAPAMTSHRRTSFVQVATASPTAPTSTRSSAVRAPARSGHTTAAALTAATTIHARTAHRAAALLSPESGYAP